jgi:hypothetical protein
MVAVLFAEIAAAFDWRGRRGVAPALAAVIGTAAP